MEEFEEENPYQVQKNSQTIQIDPNIKGDLQHLMVRSSGSQISHASSVQNTISQKSVKKSDVNTLSK